MDLPEEVKVRAQDVYDAIAQAEAKAHGCPVGEVHYHEVGALDAVADVVGACYALYLLSPDRIVASPVHVGSGTVRCAHGVMPVPAPATANLLTGVPTYGGEVFGELCTPTGAALVAPFARAFGPMPVLAAVALATAWARRSLNGPTASGPSGARAADAANGAICELVCNIDDMTPEALAYACEQLRAEGALDVYTLPGTMKKGRSGHLLTVLCDPAHEARLARAVLPQTPPSACVPGGGISTSSPLVGRRWRPPSAPSVSRRLRAGTLPTASRSMTTWPLRPTGQEFPSPRCGRRPWIAAKKGGIFP